MSATPELPTQAQETTESDSGTRSHTESLAWAMFVAGYHARIEDSANDVEFRDREAFDTHLYDQFRAVYTDA